MHPDAAFRRHDLSQRANRMGWSFAEREFIAKFALDVSELLPPLPIAIQVQ
jgi:hypothetical protein